MLRRYCVIALLLLAMPDIVRAGYLDENPDEVFSGVYERLGALPQRAARDPYVWLRLEELKRERVHSREARAGKRSGAGARRDAVVDRGGAGRFRQDGAFDPALSETAPASKEPTRVAQIPSRGRSRAQVPS